MEKKLDAVTIFVSAFVGRLVLSAVGFDNQLFQTVLWNIITVSFIFSIIELLKRIKIQKNI